MTIVLGLSVPVFLVLVTYVFQGMARRRAALSERRRVLYEKLIRSLVELLGAGTAEDRSRLISEIETSWLFASDEVLRACYGYLEAYDEVCRSATRGDALDWTAVLGKVRHPDTRQMLRGRLAEVFVQMRRDIRRGTEINDDWAQEHFDIYCWGIIADDQKASGAQIATDGHKGSESAVF